MESPEFLAKEERGDWLAKRQAEEDEDRNELPGFFDIADIAAMRKLGEDIAERYRALIADAFGNVR